MYQGSSCNKSSFSKSKFVSLERKSSVMTADAGWKMLRNADRNVYINDDITLLQAKIAKALHEKSDVSELAWRLRKL